MSIDRDQLIKEFLEERKLRKFVRKAIKLIKEKKKKESKAAIINELKLRSVIRTLIREAATDVETEVPRRKTGINVLETLLQKIVPILEDDFKSLTTDENQRNSFRSHIIRAVINVLAPVDTVMAAPDTMQEAIDVDVVDDGEKFIPARKKDFEDLEAEKEEKQADDFSIAGEDMTGRNIAYQSFNKVENQILDAYGSLVNEEDKKLFYDYLLTNLKLYFDKFEDELKASVEEPTTQAYEQEKEISPTALEEMSAAGGVGAASGAVEGTPVNVFEEDEEEAV